MCGPKFCSMAISKEVTELGQKNKVEREAKKAERREQLLQK
jgi:hypothetical protein